VRSVCLVSPKADQDLEGHAAYLAEVAGGDIGHRFLLAAEETFLLLSRNPGIGWSPRLRSAQLKGLRIFSNFGFRKDIGLLQANGPRDRSFASRPRFA
jgi:plasmid stabilization system protein ParE